MVRQGLICDVAVFVTHTLVPPRRSVNEPGTIPGQVGLAPVYRYAAAMAHPLHVGSGSTSV